MKLIGNRFKTRNSFTGSILDVKKGFGEQLRQFLPEGDWVYLGSNFINQKRDYSAVFLRKGSKETIVFIVDAVSGELKERKGENFY